MVKNVVVWFDVPTTDFKRAVKFYSTILGEEVKITDYMNQTLGMFPMAGRDGVGGDIVPPDPNLKPSPDGVRVYLGVEGKMDEVIGRVAGAGGKIIRPKEQMGKIGWIAIIRDSEGNTVGLHSAK